MTAAPHEDPAERLVALARSLIATSPDEPAWVLADLAAVRRTADRIARGAAALGASEDAAACHALREALTGAGLEPIAPEGASIAAMQAGLARLHGMLGVMVLARRRRAG